MNHLDYSNDQFLLGFSSGNFPPLLFSHEAHLRLAFLLIQKYGARTAADELCHLIRRFDQQHGDGTKFNVTVTVASCKVVFHFMQKASQANFSSLLEEFPQLKTDFLRLLRTHYGFDIFRHPQAKAEYMEPNLLPFT